MTNPLVYQPAPVPDECKFKISPSAFAQFIQAPHNWYRNEVLKENPFSHNTSSVIGTIVHYCAEQVAQDKPVDKQVIEEYIDMLEVHEDYDPSEVRKHYLDMAETLVNDYVLQEKKNYLSCELPTSTEIRDGYYAAGTCDVIQGTKEDCMLVDYKTYNSKTEPRSIPQHYKYQLLTYAYILRDMGYTVTRIRLVYVNRFIDGGISEKTGKPLKSYPPKVTVLTETITEEDFEFIKGLLELAVDSVEAAKKYPELLHVIFHDPRLRITE